MTILYKDVPFFLFCLFNPLETVQMWEDERRKKYKLEVVEQQYTQDHTHSLEYLQSVNAVLNETPADAAKQGLRDLQTFPASLIKAFYLSLPRVLVLRPCRACNRPS